MKNIFLYETEKTVNKEYPKGSENRCLETITKSNLFNSIIYQKVDLVSALSSPLTLGWR